MSEAKHTPGPWETLTFSNHELQTDIAMVKIGCRVHKIGYSGEDWANARLIAAAPELLGALKQCRLALEPYDDVKPRDWKTDREKLAFAHQAARAAIAKVEGGAA